MGQDYVAMAVFLTTRWQGHPIMFLRYGKSYQNVNYPAWNTSVLHMTQLFYHIFNTDYLIFLPVSSNDEGASMLMDVLCGQVTIVKMNL